MKTHLLMNWWWNMAKVPVGNKIKDRKIFKEVVA